MTAFEQITEQQVLLLIALSDRVEYLTPAGRAALWMEPVLTDEGYEDRWSAYVGLSWIADDAPYLDDVVAEFVQAINAAGGAR